MLALAISFGVYTVQQRWGHNIPASIWRSLKVGVDRRCICTFYDEIGQVISKDGKKTGIGMKLFERYMDDFNQAAIVPPPGSQYDNL